MPKHILFASYGNDSVALIQWAKNQNLSSVTVLYSDTGWAAKGWEDRVEQMEAWVNTLGFQTARTSSIGLEQLAKDRKGWPRNGMQFCTLELKIRPALLWMDSNDPDRSAICLVGVRREESNARKKFPEYQDQSPNHGDRPLWAPLVNVTSEQRDALLTQAGVEPLPHRSMECFPCINSNRADLRILAKDPERIAEIARIEKEMGFTSKGKPRTMFRPASKMGATGIEEVVRWAESEPGQFVLMDELNECESGYCSI